MAVITRFEEAINMEHSIVVSDEKLRHFSKQELDQIAELLLRHFPLDRFKLVNAKKLQGRMALHRKVYLDILNLKNENIFALNSVQNLTQGAFYSGKTTQEISTHLVRCAISSVDLVNSFVEYYPIAAKLWKKNSERDPEGVNADKLINYVDGNGEVEASKYARFFRKRIAYFEIVEQQPVPVTYLDAVRKWASSGGKLPQTFKAWIKEFPLALVADDLFIELTESTTSFREFIYQQTRVSFEAMLGAELPENLRKKFQQVVANENTRRALSFYSAFPNQLAAKELTGTAEARKFLKLAKYFRMLQAKYNFHSLMHKNLLNWLFGWNMSEEVETALTGSGFMIPKKNLVEGMIAIQSLSSHVIEAEPFCESAIDILFVVAELPIESMKATAQKIAFSCSWDFFEFNSVEFLEFLKKRRFLNIPKGYGQLLENKLLEMEAHGKSSLFLKALWKPLSKEQLQEATKRICQLKMKKLQVQNVLKSLLGYTSFSSLSSEKQKNFLMGKSPASPT